jgi:hypothetical protein
MSEDLYHEYNQLPDTFSGADFEMEQLINMSKRSITEQAQTAVTFVVEGHVDPLKSYAYAKKGLEIFSQLEANLRPLVVKDNRLGKAKENYHGVEMERAETGVKYDYSACGCPKWQELKEKADHAAAQLKNHEASLKLLKEPEERIYLDEVYTCYPPVRTSADGFKSTIK